MLRLTLLAYLGSIALVGAIPYQISVSLADDRGRVTPTWEKENRQLVVPISGKARTGLVDPIVEEGLLSLTGPRFANVFYENATSDVVADADLKCFLKCPATIGTAIPCIFTAVTGGDAAAILRCISKDKLCGCASCLPGPISDFVQKTVCSNSAVVDVAAADRFSPYVDFAALATSSLAIAAFRGDLYQYQLEQLKALNTLKPASASTQGDVHAMCAVGSSCGSCDCCLGGCVPFANVCVGVCVG